MNEQDKKPVAIIGQGSYKTKVMPSDLTGPQDVEDEGWDIVAIIVIALVFGAGVIFGAMVF